MADLFTLDPTTLATVELGIDSLIHQLGKMCKIVYESEDKAVCNNCIFDYNNNNSTNIYNGMGPKPFSGGKCPVCKGSGYLPNTTETSEIVQLLVDWQPKPWLFFDKNNTDERIPQGLIMTKGFVKDLPKIIQAKYIIVDYQNAIYTNNKFVRWGEPIMSGNIVKAKYVVCFWQRFAP